jgi:hypothetical protein
MRDRDQPMNTVRHDVPTSTLDARRAVQPLLHGVRELQLYRMGDLRALLNFNSRSRHRCLQFGLVHATTMPVMTIARNIWAADARLRPLM